MLPPQFSSRSCNYVMFIRWCSYTSWVIGVLHFKRRVEFDTIVGSDQENRVHAPALVKLTRLHAPRINSTWDWLRRVHSAVILPLLCTACTPTRCIACIPLLFFHYCALHVHQRAVSRAFRCYSSTAVHCTYTNALHRCQNILEPAFYWKSKKPCPSAFIHSFIHSLRSLS
jgi:hypothetical protein